jgi:hypothetical protein
VLQENGKLSDAAVTYLACGNRTKAMQCYEGAANWQMALPLLLQQTPPPAPATIRQMAQGLIDNLQAIGNHEEAGVVAATYLMDARVAVQCFVAGGCWRAAFGAVCQAGGARGEELQHELLVPGVAAAASEQVMDIVNDAGRVQKYWARLVQLRERREALAAVVRALLLTSASAFKGRFTGSDITCKVACQLDQAEVTSVCRSMHITAP